MPPSISCGSGTPQLLGETSHKSKQQQEQQQESQHVAEKIPNWSWFSLVLPGIEKLPQKLHSWLFMLHHTAHAVGLGCSYLISFPQYISFVQLCTKTYNNNKKIKIKKSQETRKEFPELPWKSSAKGWGCSCMVVTHKAARSRKKPQSCPSR